MTRDEIRQIADIVDGDNSYRHFVHRINKEFDNADASRNARVHVLFEELDDERIGFCVIGISEAKMRVWQKMFIDEGWVDTSFKIDPSAYELMYMYVKPDLRSRGIGSKILNRAFNFTRENGVHDVYAYVSDRSNSSLEFYKKMDAEVIQDFSDSGITSAFIHWQV